MSPTFSLKESRKNPLAPRRVTHFSVSLSHTHARARVSTDTKSFASVMHLVYSSLTTCESQKSFQPAQNLSTGRENFHFGRYLSNFARVVWHSSVDPGTPRVNRARFCLYCIGEVQN